MKRAGFVIECSCVMLLCAAGASLSHLWKKGPLSVDMAGVALIVPVISFVLFICISVLVPSLYAVDRFRFPITVTLPLVYTGCLIATMALVSRIGLSITRLPKALDAISVWSSPWIVGSTLVAGVVCYSVLSLFEREPAQR